MNVSNIILIVCLYPFVLLMYVLLKNEATPKKKMYYGVTLTKEQQKTPEAEQIAKEYQKQMRWGLGILMLMPLPMVFIPWFSIFMCFWMVWMLASVFVFFIPFGIANNRLKALKLEKGWKETQEQPILTEIKDAGKIRRVKWYHFLPIGAVSIGIFVWVLLNRQGQVLSIMIGSFAGFSFLFWAVAVWMDKQKTQIISTDSDVNVNYARAKKNLWKNFWVACAWVNVVYMVCMLCVLKPTGTLNSLFWITTILYILLTAGLLLWLVKKKEALDKSYQSRMDALPVDDDDNWIWGMVYYNPRDNHSMVEKRVGTGTTVNMATPIGKGFTILCGASLLSVPLLCIWMILLEFTPIQLHIEENQVVAEHLKEDYAVPMHSIRSAELLTELPKMSRNHGTSIDNLQKGSYHIKDVGSCSVFLNPQNAVFLKLETAENVYYFSGSDDEETRLVYEALR